MKKMCLTTVMGIAVATSGATANAQSVTYTVNPTSPFPGNMWQGFMNVFALPEDGGGYFFGSGWGTADLTAVFDGPVLTLGPNTIGDPNEYWYKGEGPSPGGPGAPGNKNMDANFYLEPPAGTLSGQSITFTGTVLSNTLVAPYTSVAFIKDFAADYSSNVTVTVPLTPGVFTVTLDTIADPSRHVQFGFETMGPNVWVTDVGPLGNVKVTAFPQSVPGDFDDDGLVNAADLSLWTAAYGATTVGDANNDGVSNGADFLIWQNNRSPAVVGAAGAVPEPTTAALAAAGLGLMIAARRRRPA